MKPVSLELKKAIEENKTASSPDYFMWSGDGRYVAYLNGVLVVKQFPWNMWSRTETTLAAFRITDSKWNEFWITADKQNLWRPCHSQQRDRVEEGIASCGRKSITNVLISRKGRIILQSTKYLAPDMTAELSSALQSLCEKAPTAPIQPGVDKLLREYASLTDNLVDRVWEDDPITSLKLSTALDAGIKGIPIPAELIRKREVKRANEDIQFLAESYGASLKKEFPKYRLPVIKFGWYEDTKLSWTEVLRSSGDAMVDRASEFAVLDMVEENPYVGFKELSKNQVRDCSVDFENGANKNSHDFQVFRTMEGASIFFQQVMKQWNPKRRIFAIQVDCPEFNNDGKPTGVKISLMDESLPPLSAKDQGDLEKAIANVNVPELIGTPNERIQFNRQSTPVLDLLELEKGKNVAK